MACHSEKAKAAGLDSARRLTMDSLDPTNVDRDREKWELVVRKVRAGQMPPLGMKRPDPADFHAMIASFENELDRTAKPFTPPPGLHRLNRTEYANVVRDLLELDIDASTYLPSDDSTSGFDNIAGALGISSTQVEAYVSAAQKISRLAMGYPTEPTLVVYRTREDTSQEYHVEGLPFGTRGGMLVPHTFPSDGEYTLTVTPIFGDNMSPTGFGSVPCERIEMLLDGKRLGITNWQGGGRNTPTNCSNRPGATAPAGAQPQQTPATAAAAGFGFGRNLPPMRVRFHATAGTHMVGATFPATNLAPGLDLDKHFMRSTVQTGPTPGYTFFPHVGTIRIEGPFEATQAKESAVTVSAINLEALAPLAQALDTFSVLYLQWLSNDVVWRAREHVVKDHLNALERSFSYDLDEVATSGEFDVVAGPSELFGARGIGTGLYVRDPDGNVIELRHYG